MSSGKWSYRTEREREVVIVNYASQCVDVTT